VSPLSLPSPPPEWQAFSITGWLADTFGIQIPLNLQITAYAVCLITGIVVAALITRQRLKARGADPGVIIDIGIWAIVIGIVGARTWHVLTHPDDYFGAGANPLEVFAIWNGGIAIFGSLTGGALGVWIGCRLTGVRFLSFADALAPGLLLGQAIGRLGNWFNQELYGWPTDLPWGLEIDSDNPAFPIGLAPETLFHPMFLYELVWNGVGAIVVWQLGKRLHLQWGKTLAVYLVWYGAGRAVFETIRLDPSELFLGIRSNVWGAFAAIALGIVLFIVQSRRHTGDEPSVYRPGREWRPRPRVESDDVYSDDDDGDGDETPLEPATSGAGARK